MDRTLQRDMELLVAQQSGSIDRQQQMEMEAETPEPSGSTRPVEQALQPADRGPAAWKLLGTAFMFAALLWGEHLKQARLATITTCTRWGKAHVLLMTFSLEDSLYRLASFKNHYSTLPQFAGNPYNSVVGTVATGLSHLGAPLTLPLIKRFHKYQREMIWVGCECWFSPLPSKKLLQND
jgi:hypothetical protein